MTPTRNPRRSAARASGAFAFALGLVLVAAGPARADDPPVTDPPTTTPDTTTPATTTPGITTVTTTPGITTVTTTPVTEAPTTVAPTTASPATGGGGRRPTNTRAANMGAAKSTSTEAPAEPAAESTAEATPETTTSEPAPTTATRATVTTAVVAPSTTVAAPPAEGERSGAPGVAVGGSAAAVLLASSAFIAVRRRHVAEAIDMPLVLPASPGEAGPTPAQLPENAWEPTIPEPIVVPDSSAALIDPALFAGDDGDLEPAAPPADEPTAIVVPTLFDPPPADPAVRFRPNDDIDLDWSPDRPAQADRS